MCKDRICACMVLNAPFPLIWYATGLLSEKKMFWPSILSHESRVCVSTECVLACCSMLHSLLLFCLIWFFYVPSTIFQLNRDRSSWVEPVLSWDRYVLLKDHNAVTPVRLEPTAPRSRVKHSTTEPLRSLNYSLLIWYAAWLLSEKINWFDLWPHPRGRGCV